MRCAMLSLTLLLVVPAGAAHAQRLAVPEFSDLQATPRASQPVIAVPVQQTSPALLAFGGILAGTAGAFAGGIAGAKLADTCEDCALVGLVYGFVAGGSAALPLGVHLANRRRGNYGQSLLASLAIGAMGLGMTLGMHGDGRIMIAVPMAQLLSSILIERASSH